MTILLYIEAAALIVYSLWRIKRLVSFSSDSKRVFLVFWVWPCLLFSWGNLLPSWWFSPLQYKLMQGLITGVLLLDFVYYFGMSAASDTDKRTQRLVGLGFVPLLAYLAFSLLPVREAPALVLPAHGPVQVWCSEVWNPKNYFFYRNGAGSADPANEGRPIFSPLTGVVKDVSDGYLLLENDAYTVAVGPFIPASLRVEAGQDVFAHQPLGIMGKPVDAASRPGWIHLQVVRGESVIFKEVLAGRMFPRSFQFTRLKRNLRVQSYSDKRFRF